MDSAFVANIKENGEAALNALLAKSLGQGDKEKASRTAGNAITLAGIIYVVFLLFGLLGLPAIIAQALMSFMTYGLNVILGGISETAVTAYGLYYKIQQFILFAGANIAFQGIFQALDSGLESLVLSVCRQFLFVLPVAYGMAQIVKRSSLDEIRLVWLTFLFAEGVTVLIACCFMKKIKKNKIDIL